MAFKEVLDLSADTTIALGGVNKKTGKANPTQVEGYYLGKKQVEDRKKKSGFSYIYILQTPKGNIGVWGKTNLDQKMVAAVPGTMLRITQSGTVPTPNGDMYKFKVEFDADNTIEVAGLESSDSSSSSSSNEDSNEDNSYASAGSDEEETTDGSSEDAAQSAALAAAERKARVEALLKGGKRKTT